MPANQPIIRYAAILAAVAIASSPDRAAAQCPDGSPPPCGGAVRRVAARSTPPPNVSERRRSFLVLPFRNLSRAAEHQWLVEGSPVLISDALSRNEAVKVVPDERLYPALKRAGLTPGGVMDLTRVRTIATETGGWTAVTGEILLLGNRLRVSARAFDVVSNAEVLRAVEESAPGEDIREVYQRLGTRLIRVAGIDTATAANLATTTTGSVDAYRAYVRGVAHMNRSEPRRARDAFLEAVRLDSTYAQAYLRLAEAELAADPRQITNLQSPLYRYARRAAALADSLPARERELVLAINDLLSGRFGSSRDRLRRLLDQDSTNVDAMEWLSGIEVSDPILVAVGGGERPRGSMNRGLALAKRALELDPSRQQIFANLVQTYLLAAGLTPGFAVGYRQEAASLPAMVMGQPARTFIPLLRDTIVLIPTDSAFTIPRDTLKAAQARALDAARQWVRRWLDVARTQAEAHLWASRAHSMAGDFAAALQALETADSLGVETGMENVPARRMSLLAQLGRYADGRRIADSLWQKNALDVSQMTAYAFEGVGWAFSLFVLDGDYDRATAILDRLTTVMAPAAAANPMMPPEALAFVFLTGAVKQYFAPPLAVRAKVFEKLLADATTIPSTSLLSRLLPFHARVTVGDTAIGRRDMAMRLLTASKRLEAAGRADLAFQLASDAARDSVAKRSLDSLAWYTVRREALRKERIATQSRFRATRVTVTDSMATFSWAVQGETFDWYRAETGIGDADYLWEAEFTVAAGKYEVLVEVSNKPGTTPKTGTLRELLAAAAPQLHQIVSADSTVPHRVLSRSSVRVEPEPGGFRMVLRDPKLVAALRSERPKTVQVQFKPCVKVPDEPAARCTDDVIPVTYP